MRICAKAAVGAVPLAMMLALAACSTNQVVGSDPTIHRASADVLPAPTPQDSVLSDPQYRVGAFDKLRIDVLGVTELQRDVQTDAQGAFLYPLVGRVQAGGHTLDEVTRFIQEHLAGRFVKNPQVSINLTEVASQSVTVSGQVTKPGQYPISAGMTLQRAVAVAGGTTDIAKLQDVVVFRTAASQHYVALYNLKAISHGNYPDPIIYPNDIVQVGDSPARRLFKDVLQSSALLTAPLILVRR